MRTEMDGRRTPVRGNRKELIPHDYVKEFNRMTSTMRDGKWSRSVGLRAVDALLDEYLDKFGAPPETTNLYWQPE